MTDGNGNTTTNTITIDVTDDVPTASADTNSVTEGAIVTGNVLTDGTTTCSGRTARRDHGGRRDRGCGGQHHVVAGERRGWVGIAGTYGALTLQRRRLLQL